MYEFFEDESVQLGSNESDPDDCFHDDELKIIEWQNHLPPSSKEKFARAPCDLPSWPKTVDPVDPDELSQALDQPAFLRLMFVEAQLIVSDLGRGTCR